MRIATPRCPYSNVDYIKYPKEGFPKRIFWKIIAGGQLHSIQLSDAIFDEWDLKIRKLI